MVIDTNIIIDFFKKEPTAVTFFNKNENLVTSYVVVGELLQGVKNKKEQTQVKKLLTIFDVHLGSNSISQTAIELLYKHKLKHNVNLADMLIAATALELNTPLVTLNTKHFSCIIGLQLIKP